MSNIQLIQGDCLEKLKELEDNSVDSIVTDPPYGLSFMGKKWDYDVPTTELWEEAIRVLKPGGHLLAFFGTRTYHRGVVRIEDAGFEVRDMVSWVYASGFPKSHNIAKSIDKMDVQSDLAKQHEGWGTALKPAVEPIVVARKPLSEKTVAKNVLKWGTGGINIDECRVEGKWTGSTRTNSPDSQRVYGGGYKKIKFEQHEQGRFPANFIHDGSDEVVGLFPETKPSKQNKQSDNRQNIGNSMFIDGVRSPENSYTDQGSAARFFYCAKASKSERNAGLEGFEEKSNMRVNAPRNNEEEKHSNKMSNFHPTVKPIKLMQYLCRLVTPKGGTVLDPFMGSGSTGIASKKEGFNFIGIELDREYYEIAKSRIDKSL